MTVKTLCKYIIADPSEIEKEINDFLREAPVCSNITYIVMAVSSHPDTSIHVLIFYMQTVNEDEYGREKKEK